MGQAQPIRNRFHTARDAPEPGLADDDPRRATPDTLPEGYATVDGDRDTVVEDDNGDGAAQDAGSSTSPDRRSSDR
mgnify:CR=1 FL=1